MGFTYSQDLRDRVIAARDEGLPTIKVTRLFRVSPSWVRRVMQRRREFGQTTPLPRGGVTVVNIDLVRLRHVDEKPDATARELHAKLGVDCSVSAVDMALRRLGLSFKEKTLHAAEQDRPDVARRRVDWKLGQHGFDARRLIFVAETWAKTNMTRLRGRSPRGQRLVSKSPHGHWSTTTLIAALGIERMRCSTVVDGAIDGHIFESFVQQVLVPQLRPGDLVVLDNLSSHKRRRTRNCCSCRRTRRT